MNKTLEEKGTEVKKKFMFQDKAIDYVRTSFFETEKSSIYPDLISKKIRVLIGPHGSGKTGILVEYARLLDVPYHIVDSDELDQKETGIIKHALSSLVRDSNLEKAENGIIIFDEINNLPEDLKQEIVSLVKGNDYEIKVNHKNQTINSSKITVFGTSREKVQREDNNFDKLLVPVKMNMLDAKDLKQILTSSPISPIRRLEENLKGKGVSFSCSEEDLSKLANMMYIEDDPFRYLNELISDFSDENLMDILTSKRTNVNLNEISQTKAKGVRL